MMMVHRLVEWKFGPIGWAILATVAVVSVVQAETVTLTPVKGNTLCSADAAKSSGSVRSILAANTDRAEAHREVSTTQRETSMRCRLTLGDTPQHPVHTTLLGQNIELAGDTADGLLSERLSNSFLTGPADPQTHVAYGWEVAWHTAGPGVRFALEPGMGPFGKASQLIHKFGGKRGGIVQNHRFVRGGERLIVTLWARAQHDPARLRVGFRPAKASLPDYAEAFIDIDACYWKPYQVELAIPARAGEDSLALFYCDMDEDGMVYLDQIHVRPAGEGVLNRKMVEAMTSLRMGPLRFPGGHVSSAYHWWMGTGPQERRATQPDAMFRIRHGMRYEFGTDEYLSLCRDLGITPHLTVNVGSGTPKEAAEWAAYCRQWWRSQDLTAPAMYWEIGNETNLRQEVGHSTAEMYVETLRAYVPGIRQAYPEGRIIANGGKSGHLVSAGSSPWRKVVLEGAADYFDMIAVHAYVSISHDATGDARQVELVAAADKIARKVKEAIGALRNRHLDKKTVAITEWNLWTTAAHNDGVGCIEPYDVEHSLLVSLVLNRWVRMGPKLELSNFYHLINAMGIFISHPGEFTETLLADVFRLYRPALPGSVLKVDVDCPILPGGRRPAVDAVAVRADHGVELLLVNCDRSRTAHISLDRQTSLTGSGLKGADPFDMHMVPFEVASSDGQFDLPPLSVARVALPLVPE